MSQSIIIESINFDGEFAIILLTPYNNDNVVNIGTQQLPYTFNPTLINPLLEIYGTYTLVINENGKDCTYFLNVVKETPTPTPTITPTKTLITLVRTHLKLHHQRKQPQALQHQLLHQL
jgi:hypothetical protein